MTGRPPRDVRADAKHAIVRRLTRENHASPEAFAAELLVILDGIHIGLTDTSRPADPAADPFTRPDHTSAPTPDWHAARQALKGNQQPRATKNARR